MTYVAFRDPTRSAGRNIHGRNEAFDEGRTGSYCSAMRFTETLRPGAFPVALPVETRRQQSQFPDSVAFSLLGNYFLIRHFPEAREYFLPGPFPFSSDFAP